MRIKSVFDLGSIVMTRTVDELRRSDPKFDDCIAKALTKYCRADWSEMEHEEDKKANVEALKTGTDRIFATYNTNHGKIYIITECDHSVTTVLFPDEY